MGNQKPSIQETLDNIDYVAWHGIRFVNENKLEEKDLNTTSVTMLMPARDDLLNYVGIQDMLAPSTPLQKRPPG